jgi:hypothetical protein
MKKILLVVLVLFLVQTSSFAVGSKDTMGKIMSSWKGEHIDTVINKWGYPTSEKKFTEHTLYVWDSGNVLVEDLLGITYTQRPSCTRTFEVDSNNVIIKGAWEGVACPITRRAAKKWVNPKNDPWDK